MSNRRSAASRAASATAIAWAITAAPAAHAYANPLEDYLRCVAREYAQPLRDTGAATALLKVERYAICYRLNLPARDAPGDATAAPCRAHPESPRGAARMRQAAARQQSRVRLAAAHVAVAARDARAIAAALSGEEAAHALRVARDLEVQAAALQRHGDAPDTDAAGAPPCPPPA